MFFLFLSQATVMDLKARTQNFLSTVVSGAINIEQK